jgi:hypothetical protein
LAESDTLISSLNARIDTLTRENAQANHESKTRKIAIRDLTAKLATSSAETAAHAQTIATLTTERDGLKTAATASPGELQAKNDALTLQIRTRSHQDRFNSLAEADGCDPATLAAAWKLAGYSPEADEPDDAKLTEAITRVKTDLPMAFKSAQSGTAAAAAAKKPLAAGPGGDRGSPEKTAGRMRVLKSQMKDFGWMQRNQKAMNEAHANGTFELIEG